MTKAQPCAVRIAPELIEGRRAVAASSSTAAIAREIEQAIAARFELPHGLVAPLRSALVTTLERKGRMVRPLMAYRVAGAFGAVHEPAIDLAVALEYFHTASLIFDDLPCMDDAGVRRGNACIHHVYGESTAILAALALINRAYALVWSAANEVLPHRRQRALCYVEHELGISGLIQGQSLDLNFHMSSRTLQSAERAARCKTVPLVALALVLPAILHGASARQVQLLERISLAWGLAYQIADDLKDVLRSQDEAGKTTAIDALQGRPNIANLIGVSAAVERLARWLRAGDCALDNLCQLHPALDCLHDFRSMLKNDLNLLLESAGAVPIDRKR